MHVFSDVYQFKITLKGTKPPVWRRIQVPETYTFYDFHVAVQDAMGWTDTHLHEFTIKHPQNMEETAIGIPDDDALDFGRVILEGWRNKIADFFRENNKTAIYVYDFGDFWEHKIEFEGVFPKDPSKNYPVCTAGRRACPPEDCGGSWMYMHILRGDHPMQENYADFDPVFFDPKEVYFEDPEVRFDLMSDLLDYEE